MVEQLIVAHAKPPARLTEALHVPETETGKQIGVLVLCGQGPVQERRSKVKIASLEGQIPGATSEHGHEANSWMRLIARAAGELDQTGDVGVIIPSGKATGGEYKQGEETIAPTEADLMRDIIEKVYGNFAPQSETRFAQARIELETEAKNTLYNFINAANIIDRLKRENPQNPDLNNVWFVGSHFHVPRLKLLASLFGFDPSHVLSAEEVLLAASKQKMAHVKDGGLLDPEGFNKQQAFQTLLQTRISGGEKYFKRKRERADRLLDGVIDSYLAQEEVPFEEREAKKQEMKAKLYIEEQKDIQMRMRGERRWVRGLATQARYVLPLSGAVEDNSRLKKFLLHFSSEELSQFGIDRTVLENASNDDLDQVMNAQIRPHINTSDWSWEVVNGAWENEQYPSDVQERLKSFSLLDADIENLSSATTSPLVV